MNNSPGAPVKAAEPGTMSGNTKVMKTIQSTAIRSGVVTAFKRRFLPLILGIAVPAFAFLAIPAVSEAGHDRYGHCNSHRKVVGHCSRCNTPIYSHYQVIGYDNCGAPRYGWVKQPHRCSHHSRSRGHPHLYSFYDWVRRFR